jgi:hypothetical protein
MELGVSYIPAHLPEHIATDMGQMAAIGCTEVLVALQENHLATLTGALDFGARLAKEQGIRPYAVIWGLANTFGGGRMSNLLLRDTSLWCQDRDGVPFPQSCLNHPEFPRYVGEIALRCRAAGYEGVFVDEPTRQACFCPHCQAAFAASTGGALATASEPEIDAFRARTVWSYTAGLCAHLKALDPTLVTITCVMPSDRDTWQAVAAIPELDVFGTDPYWLVSGGKMSIAQAADDAREVRRICQQEHKVSQIWLNCWRIPAGLEEELYNGGKALAAAGCDALYTWSFRGGLGTNEACDDPARAWASVERLYREVSGR